MEYLARVLSLGDLAVVVGHGDRSGADGGEGGIHGALSLLLLVWETCSPPTTPAGCPPPLDTPHRDTPPTIKGTSKVAGLRRLAPGLLRGDAIGHAGLRRGCPRRVRRSVGRWRPR